MKRFYCTICKKFKRVRQYPANIQNMDALRVQDRMGTCKWHNQASRSDRNYEKKVS